MYLFHIIILINYLSRSKLVLEMASVLLARQYRLVATAFLPCGGDRSETLFFCKDSRQG